MRKYCPITKEVAFERLDKRLSDEEKKEIIEAEDTVFLHFSLGMWIRNTWIYNNELKRINSLLTSLGKKDFIFESEFLEFRPHADMISDTILEAYQKHLKKNYDRKTTTKK